MSVDRAIAPQSLPDWLSYLERIHPFAIDMGLDRVARVRDRLGLLPSFPVVAVAGTNGKGSVCAMLESILSSARYKVGVYTSPHLLRYNERVRVQGREAADEELVNAFARIEKVRGEVSLTYFEFGTLAAMDVFIRERVDLAVLEVGLGGRLDAVNAFDSDCGVVTSVDFDHMEFLGNNRDSIGAEKAGIFRAGRPAICGESDAPAGLLRRTKEIGAKLHRIGRDYGFSADPNRWQFWSALGKRSALPYPALRGDYQLGNAATALSALEQLTDRLPVDMGAIRRGLLDVQLQGRFQVLPGRPVVILDVGHNPHAARGLASSLRRLPGGGRTIAVFAMLRDKDIEGVAAALRDDVDEWLVAGLSSPRGADAERIRQALATARVGAPVAKFDTAVGAYEHAIRSAGQNDKILVFGSFYTVGAVLAARG
ncbi:MAG TPA: bifunctional tetrahydrofolate synthase/dihydrofolate synthase [Burkholderiales bacterium]|jgi:dihydrofolate synthase/folylpolyglutamate synthase|nr:bifunctional tetrahydrofolate synthase/dihydrofolate synthase [Burkholderiales bacterium]